ncbi:TRAP transporter large permease [Roseibium sp.]|uniref:TRAP transporter large permease n=1 Tax=Roseibium sp. TaxID=1936156 RepID=UPI00329A6C2E
MPFLTAFGVLFGALAAGMPIFLVLGATSLLLFWIEGEPLIGVAQVVVNRLNSAALIAVPFFVIAATFMAKGDDARAHVDFAHAWVGRLQGGLGLVCVVATTIFAAISGSSVATAMAMGTVLVPAMMQARYERHFALGVVGASGTLGILIPPSLGMIIFALVADESVPQLFLAGVVPGLIQVALFVVIVLVYARRKNYPAGEPMSRDEFIAVNLHALPALTLPVIVLGGIYGGFVTVTEAAGLSAIVAIALSVLVYKECRPGQILEFMADGVKSAGSIIIIVAGAMLFGHWIIESGAPHTLVDWVIDQEIEAWQFLLFMNVIMLILGTFLEGISIILITVPLVLPLLQALGISPIHYAIIVTVNLEIGLLTPPIGLNLFVLSSISKAPVTEVVRGVLPFFVGMLAFLMLITFVPVLSTWLPGLVFGR